MPENPHLGFAELVREPVEALVKTVALHSAGGLNVPLGKKRISINQKSKILIYPAVSKVLESQLVGELGGGHCIGQVLLVGKH